MDILEHGFTYHIFNRANNKDLMFYESWNYFHFMDLFDKYISDLVDVYAYCLIPNHFHFLVRVKDLYELPDHVDPNKPLWRSFSNFFNAYTKKINQCYERRGSLFQERYRRKRVITKKNFLNLLKYIHFNPSRHEIAEDFREYPYSSYQALISVKPSKIERNLVLELFDDLENFIAFHNTEVDEGSIKDLI
jgi:REP element-mobilizing transposase RayT